MPIFITHVGYKVLIGKMFCWLIVSDLRTMILEKETELAKINKELKDLEHYKVSYPVFITLFGMYSNMKESYDHHL